jgi:N-acetyl-anhydromuramyl-L-alanine amidase AmpD
MVLLRTALVLACAALAAAVLSAPAEASVQVKRPAVNWQPTASFTPAKRQAQQIRYVVVHVTEGSFWGSVEWLQNPEAHASSHYVVSRQGKIVQMVREADIAWHAGNKRINELSTGVEHEGMTHDPAGFTRAQYEASAKLVAYIARRSLMPITRKHIIGHDEVPSPFDPSKSGGANKHTDPGPHWNWNLYLNLVRKYAYPTPPVSVSSTLSNGQTVAGSVPWRAATKGPVRRVDFYVNGKLRWRSSRVPHVFAPGRGLNTTALKNGTHALEVRAFGKGNVAVRQRLTVRVRNAPFELTTAGISAGDRVQGVLRFRAAARTAPVESIALFVEGKRVATRHRAPFEFTWDARKAKPGPHVLLVRAKARDGRISSRSFRLVVARPAAPPPGPRTPPAPPAPTPPDVPAPVLHGQSLEDGQTVQGTVEWRPRMTGRVVRVEFLVDGQLRHAATVAPFALRWDTTREAPGERVLSVRLVGPTGKSAEGSVTVVVAAP